MTRTDGNGSAFAIKVFQFFLRNKTLEMNKNNADTYNGRGVAQMSMQNYTEAEKDFKKAIELNSDEPGYGKNLKMVQTLMKK